MHRFRVGVGVVLACISGLSWAQSTTSTESYTYDALGRLVKVEVVDGEQDGASRDYNYDNADNRTEVNSTAGSNIGGSGLDPLPSECALLPAATPAATDGELVWPRVLVSGACQETLELAFNVSYVSGQGAWTPPGQFYQGSKYLKAGSPDNETSKLMYIQPVAGSVPSGDQLELNVEWSVVNFVGSTVNTAAIVDSAQPPCVLGPFNFTVADGSYAWPRVYAPTSNGCGQDIELEYTIELVAPASLPPNPYTHGFFAGSATLGANDHAKLVWINPISGLATSGNPVELRVHWSVASGSNAVIAGPGYSVVTISAD